MQAVSSDNHEHIVFTIIYITTEQTEVLSYNFYNRYSETLKLINHVHVSSA